MRSENQRIESFTLTGQVQAKVSSRSGDVTVEAHEGADVVVTFSARGSNNEHLLEQAEVTFDAERNYLEVRTQSRDSFDSFKSLKDLVKRRSWFELGNSDVDVQIKVPAGSSIEIATVSGDSQLRGGLANVKISAASGDVVVSGPVDTLDVRSASGDVQAVQVRNSFECRSASGDVKCDGAGNATVVHTASGDVNLKATIPGEISVRAVSGDVRISVARGLAIDVEGNSVSGDMASSIPLDSSGDGASEGETVAIKVATVSGDVRIDRAS